jgi:Ca2+-binding EF-hand superfamily protein
MSKRLLLVFACLAASATVAAQQASPKLTVEVVRAMDSNRDGRITKAEFDRASGSADLFESVDVNGDGILDAKEIRANIRVRARFAN